MKKMLCIIVMAVLMIVGAMPVFAADENINVVVNGVTLNEKGVAIEGRTLVPVRAICEALGLEVRWTQETQSVMMIDGQKGIGVVMRLGQSHVIITGGGSDELEVPPQAVNGKTMVPVRFLASTFGFVTQWDSATNTVTIVDTGEVPRVITDEDKRIMQEIEEFQKQSNPKDKWTDIQFAKEETDYEYLENKGYELLRCSIDNNGQVDIAIKNNNEYQSGAELFYLGCYTVNDNFIVESEEIGFYELGSGETREYNFKLYQAEGIECYIVIQKAPF